MAGSSVVGLGVGVILLLILWTLTGIAWVQLSRKQGGLRVMITLLSLLLTVALFLIPTDDGKSKRPGTISPDQLTPQDPYEIYDYMFIWKAVLIVLMIISVFGGIGVYLMEFWSAKVHGSLPIPRKKFEDFK